MHKSPFHGFSVEFAEHRLYNPGESTKHIDWKLFARTDKLFVKRYEEETNLRAHFLLDTSSSMLFPKDQNKVNKKQFSVYAIASMMELLKKQRDAVGLSLFTDDFKLETPAKTSLSHHRYLLSELETVLNDNVLGNSTSLVESIHHFAEKVPKRSLVVIFSDMFDSSKKDSEELFEALRHLKHKKHDVVVFHVLDKKNELELEFENRPHIFVDLETGVEVKLNPHQVKDKYKQLLASQQSHLKDTCGAYKIDYVQANIAESVYDVLLKFLVKRGKVSR